MIRLERLSKAYGHGGARALVLDDVDFTVETGQIAAIVGPSGAGKSTLAACINLLERPTSGSVIVNGENLTAVDGRRLREARRRIGTIFQQDGLFTRRTAAENVALPLDFLGVDRAQARSRVAELLDRVGLTGKEKHYPHQLSGGQRQRVGIARALALRPSVLLSDEATSGLDPASTASVLGLLRELRADLGLSIVLITHEMETVRDIADTVARLDHGRIVESGALVDLLRDPASPLGRALQPTRDAAPAADGDGILTVVYTSADVPGDWLLQLSSTLGGRVSLLGAQIEAIAGQSIGHATLSVRAEDAARAAEILRGLGLETVGAPDADLARESVVTA